MTATPNPLSWGLTRRKARHHNPLPALVLLKHDAQRALQRGHHQLAGLGQNLRGGQRHVCIAEEERRLERGRLGAALLS